ncbi:MAG TPA: sensor histidine kinase [Flavisolibacter sp.]|nr:sensor histidine kinase [Flavisolibacter sp.]
MFNRTHTGFKKAIFSFMLLLTVTAYGQDTAYQRIMAANDDSAKVMQLIGLAKTVAKNDKDLRDKLIAEAIRIAHKINFAYGIGIDYMSIAHKHAAKGEETQAVANYKKALSYLEKSSDKEAIAKCILNIADCVEATGDYQTGINYAMKAIRVLEGTPHKAMMARAYTSIGATFYNIENHAKSIEYLRKGLPLAEESKDTGRLVMALYVLSAALSSEKRMQEGKAYAEQAISVATAYGRDNELHLAHQSMAELLCKLEDGKKAIPHAELSLKHARAVGSVHYVLPATMIMAEAYGKANLPQKQVVYLKEAESITEETGIVMELNLIYKGLSEAYEKMGQYKDALAFHKKYIVFRDSTEGEKTKKHIAELELQYQSAEKEKTIAKKNLEVAQKEVQLQKSRQMNLYGIGSAMVALLAALLVFLHFRHKRKLDQKQLQSMKQEKEIQLLQAVMQGEEKERSRIAKDLHDGVAGMLAAVKMHFNSIALHVGGVLQTEGYQQGLKLLDEASQEVRKTSHNLMPEVLLQHGLDEAIRRYCNNVTNSSKLLVQYDSIGELSRFVDSFELSVYRIVQELLNNIVKHSKASEAIVQITCQQQLLSITIEDNGIGLTADGSQKDGIGLKSLQSRVKAMNGRIEFDSAVGQGLNAYLEFETAGLEKAVAVIA